VSTHGIGVKQTDGHARVYLHLKEENYMQMKWKKVNQGRARDEKGDFNWERGGRFDGNCKRGA